ncbi:methylmalonyl Co-A mutase-associated GTPase MeaB [Kaustia mangrovi]|uniref:Methylmalonyl Co-A mutase-associated GTPase MeaB n=1 Tax=Kaustia mangrovi TaxID=2593653 RepID=A0A7S8HB11_9HYPH|nr:methylmalonyl Co-A mutase-associated GTPase MeaB [Kaustia mangrovi]QPC42031.1 methylmalonyl Co-A mutase-associated GTPase MeaB [Kaustia mangrovi]
MARVRHAGRDDRPTDIDALARGVRAGERAAIGRAITLIESRRADHEAQAQELLVALLPHSGKAYRVGITGMPGVGKSTTIDTLGRTLTGQGHKVAVLAVDPTSTRTGGSILGDKTRMAGLANDPNAFVRPSPSAGTLGGVARRTRETMIVCEAAGFDVVIVETVGIGQSETAVADMVDIFLVLLLPGGGDDLQGLKKGVLEIADLIAINKADGDNEALANRTATDYRAALQILEPANADWHPPVLTVSGLRNMGLDRLWAEVERHRALFTETGALLDRRRAQQVKWMWAMLEERLIAAIRSDPQLGERLPELEAAVREGRITPTLAVKEITERLGL